MIDQPRRRGYSYKSKSKEELSMELELLDYSIDELRWADRTSLTGKSLTIAKADLQELLKELSHGIRVDYELVRPGESTRIVHVLDTVLPIAKLSESVKAFLGF